MTAEEIISKELTGKFGYLENTIRIPRARRMFIETSPEKFEEIFSYAAKELKFTHLVSITGFDEQDRLSFMYHLAQDSGIVLNIKISAAKDHPVIKTVTPYFPGAEIYERELVDLFGTQVAGLPEGSRYPLTDDWPAGQFPLRKDWKSPA